MEHPSHLSPASFWAPEHVADPHAWVGHIPFAFWLVEAIRPRCLVELGTHSGNSYFAFCQAVSRLALPTLCHSVDSWRGDDQAGHYGDEIYEAVDCRNRNHYAHFSTLHRCLFDEAVDRFPDGSIDLLHIDGLHTYEAVKHDFETWSPKLSEDAVVLFHDTDVRDRGFGVYRLFSELSDRHPAFEFTHSYGLGVVAVGRVPDRLSGLLKEGSDRPARDEIRASYSRLGEAVLDHAVRAVVEAVAAEQGRELARIRSLQEGVHARLDEVLTGINALGAADEAYRILREECDNLVARLDSVGEENRRYAAEIVRIASEKGRIASEMGRIAAEKGQLEEKLDRAEERVRLGIEEGRRLSGLVRDQEAAIAEMQASLGWSLQNRARGLRDALFGRDGGMARGRAAMARFFRSSPG
ncbi:class I SAM-dependent methyltransferase [Aquisphaera insulae]|uniref:class I SAM-dependent methyltransferase n=1 Tax=Aquisphaera insulae TaxID=2712864 RepID=UPI0013EE19D4|nr:class I SAM-dependent methyltransferase [Aquisphaera insulae]